MMKMYAMYDDDVQGKSEYVCVLGSRQSNNSGR